MVTRRPDDPGIAIIELAQNTNNEIGAFCNVPGHDEPICGIGRGELINALAIGFDSSMQVRNRPHCWHRFLTRLPRICALHGAEHRARV